VLRRFGRTRIGLLVLAGLGGVALWVSQAIFGQFDFSPLPSSSWSDLLAIVIASVLVMVGHLLRAQRSRIAINQAYPAGLADHFGALSIGFLFNALLPFRLGELIRTWLLARKLRISLLYTLSVILIERLLDVILVAAMFLLSFVMFPQSLQPTGAFVALGSLVGATVVTTAFFALVGGGRVLRLTVATITSWLSPPIRRRVQFSVWAVIYGYQRFRAQPRQVAAYLATFALSWVSYLGATAILVASLLGDKVEPGAGWLAGVLGPFVSASLSVLPISPEFFVRMLSDFVGQTSVSSTPAIHAFGVAVWFTLTLPIALVGLVWIFFYSVLPHRTRTISENLPDYSNKLDRMSTVGAGLPDFVDSWFRGENLVHVLHELEVRGDLTLVQVFKGGSNAITVLSQQGDHQDVKKIVPSAHADKLKMQYDWLVDRRNLDGVVTALDESSGPGYYAISLAYTSSTIPLFDYIHSRPLADATKVLSEVWEFMQSEIYRLDPPTSDPERRDAYVEDRLMNRVRDAARVNTDIADAMVGERIIVNGVEYANFDSVMSDIRANARAWGDIAHYQRSAAVHGDLTVDNVLVNVEDDRFLLIDPSDDNDVRGPVVDVGRHMQSLGYGYEFLNVDDTPVRLARSAEGLGSITFADNRSDRYAQLERFVSTQVLPQLLTAGEIRSVPFHVGLLYGRMLSHRVVINPETALKYYGTSVVALNVFLRQYE
jgi:uncharacterized membrane protein YbhN (UPF0104 family)